jgi:hypothetical protein
VLFHSTILTKIGIDRDLMITPDEFDSGTDEWNKFNLSIVFTVLLFSQIE